MSIKNDIDVWEYLLSLLKNTLIEKNEMLIPLFNDHIIPYTTKKEKKQT
jgi:hypothetical protein